MKRIYRKEGFTSGNMTIVSCLPGRLMLVRCFCGMERIISTKNFIRNFVCNCGINPPKRKYTRHAMTKTKEFKAWVAMKQRCTNKNFEEFYNYGGRGISVCKRWSESFVSFYQDMGACPEGFSLDRIDVNGNYEPSNCRWASVKTQNLNKRNTVYVDFDGERASIWHLSFLTGVPENIIRSRLRLGYDPLWAITKTPRKKGVRVKRVARDGGGGYKPQSHESHKLEVLSRLQSQQTLALAQGDTKTAGLIARIITLLSNKKTK